jgi:adenosylhomocysteine nucleosidase
LHLLVAFALEMEFAPWRQARKFLRVSSEPPLYEARVGEASVRVVLTGMGPRGARHAANRALEQGANACVVCGLAGALREGFHRGEIVVGARVREVESQRVLPSDARLLAMALHKGAQSIALCTASYVAATGKAKRRMAPLADAVDMESFLVMEQAAQRGVPAAAIRVIGDLVDEDMPVDFERVVNPQGGIDRWRATAAALKSPHRLPRLIRVGMRSRRATKGLAEFLDRFAISLAAAPFEPSSVEGRIASA